MDLASIPKIISVDDHVVEPAHVWERWLPAKFRDRGPEGRAPRASASIDYVGAGSYDEHVRRRLADQGRQLVLRGPRLHRTSARRGRRVSDRDEHDADPHHLRRDAPRVLRPEGPARGHGPRTGSRRRCASRPSPASAVRRSWRPRTRSSGMACVRRVQRLDGRGVVRRLRRPADPAVHHPAVGRRARGGRGAAQRGAGRARGVLQRDPAATSACRPSTPATGSRSSPRAPRRSTVVVHAHRLVVEDAGDVGRRAGRGRARRWASATRCRRSSTSCSRACSCASPTLQLAYTEGQIGWIPYVARARRRRVGRATRAGRGRERHLPSRRRATTTANVSGCFFSDRHGLESLDEVGVDNITVRDRLPAHRLDVARHPRDHDQAARRARRRRDPQDRPRQRHRLFELQGFA